MNTPRDFGELAEAIYNGTAWYLFNGKWKKMGCEIQDRLAFNHVYIHWNTGTKFHIGDEQPERELVKGRVYAFEKVGTNVSCYGVFINEKHDEWEAGNKYYRKDLFTIRELTPEERGE